MRILEVRRHSMRHKPGVHLSPEGIFLAKLVGSGTDPFDLVVTSDLPRAIETAIAMGFAVDETDEVLGHLPGKVFDKLDWPNSLAGVAEIVARDERCARFTKAQANAWCNIVARISESQRALIVTHGGIVELGAIGCLPTVDHESWGGAIAIIRHKKTPSPFGNGVSIHSFNIISKTQLLLADLAVTYSPVP